MEKNINIIECRELTVRYGKNTILENLSFNVNKGEIFAVAGGSGCGKTTLLRQLVGLERPTSGEIYIDGINLLTASKKEKKSVLKKFGVMFQSSGLFASMTLAENIALVLEAYTELSDENIAEIINIRLASVGLSGYGDYLPSEISGGMKKRAGIARAMALDPDILFFDEPCSGLDPVTAASIDKLIKELNMGLGTTIFLVTHDLASIFNIADRIIMLDKSVRGIIAEGSPGELRKQAESPLVFNFFNRIAQ